jgi:hypothetical protein
MYVLYVAYIEVLQTRQQLTVTYNRAAPIHVIACV